jgi:UPF0755 protein
LVAGAITAYVLTRPPSDDFHGGSAGPEVVIPVTEGETLTEIGTALVDKGVVKSMAAFLRAVEADPRSRRIQPGGHRVQTAIPAATAIEQLLDPARRTAVVTIPEGFRLSQVLSRLEAFGLARSALTEAQTTLTPPFPKARSLEGFLLPGQYAFVPDITATDALRAMIVRFERLAQSAGLEQSSAALGLSPFQGLVVASLLQAEGHPEDYPKVLRVILNRLKIGMALQLDATVLYALDRFGDVRVTSRDLQVDSPYNTYKYPGLPPGPINNPGEEAIRALGSPADGDWIYYITVKPGDTRFTRSSDEFLRWKVEFRRNYEAGLFE